MRLGGPIFTKTEDPDRWAAAHLELGYRAATCPVGPSTPADIVIAYEHAAKRTDIIIAEVGAWSNPISRDSAERAKAIDHCQRHLALADKIGALCCVNIAGSRGEKWDGPDPANDSQETFDLIVESVRKIIDAVKPTRADYTLETMPWIPPDSPDSYLDLIRAIDRQAFAVHLDPVNMINCPRRAYHTGDFLRQCFKKLGPYIRSCHAKDIHFTQHLTVHLDECPPGTGLLDYQTFLRELSLLPADIPLLMEHMTQPEEYNTAAKYIRTIAGEIGVQLK